MLLKILASSQLEKVFWKKRLVNNKNMLYPGANVCDILFGLYNTGCWIYRTICESHAFIISVKRKTYISRRRGGRDYMGAPSTFALGMYQVRHERIKLFLIKPTHYCFARFFVSIFIFCSSLLSWEEVKEADENWNETKIFVLAE